MISPASFSFAGSLPWLLIVPVVEIDTWCDYLLALGEFECRCVICDFEIWRVVTFTILLLFCACCYTLYFFFFFFRLRTILLVTCAHVVLSTRFYFVRVVSRDFTLYVLFHTILLCVRNVTSRFYFVRVYIHTISFLYVLLHHGFTLYVLLHLVHTILNLVLFNLIFLNWSFWLRCFVDCVGRLKLVFSSIDIAGSFSWFAVLILLKCKSGVNISPASLLFWFDEVGIFFNWNRRFFFLWFVVTHDFDFLIRGGITHDHHVLLPTILTFYFIDVCFITCCYTRFWLFLIRGVLHTIITCCYTRFRLFIL